MGTVSRRVQLVLLFEDQQHEVFSRRFFGRMGWDKRKFRVERSPPGKGSAERFVRRSFPQELKTYRGRRNHVECMLVIMIDGDAGGVDARVAALDEECRNADVQPPQWEDQVAVLVPTWRIETWLAYLDGEDADTHAVPDTLQYLARIAIMVE